MGIFRRRTRAPGPGSVEGFWEWWTGSGAAATARAIEAHDPGSVAGPLGEAVAAVHPGLAWELAKGELSEHLLVVTAAGGPHLRALARRWLLAAPPADETWSYTDHRPPAEDPEAVRLTLGDGPEIAFADVRVAARLSGTRFDVQVHHPAFARMPSDARGQVAFLALDAALGEHDVEIWIGALDPTEHPVLDGFGLAALRAVVRDHQAQYVDQDGAPTWVMLQGETSAGPVLALAQVPLHPIVAPQLDVHVAVLLPYASSTEAGLPADDSLAALRALDDRLAVALGRDGRVVAHQSAAGTRVLHAYVDGTTDAVERVRSVAASWPEGEAHVQAMADPGWESVSHLA